MIQWDYTLSILSNQDPLATTSNIATHSQVSINNNTIGERTTCTKMTINSRNLLNNSVEGTPIIGPVMEKNTILFLEEVRTQRTFLLSSLGSRKNFSDKGWEKLSKKEWKGALRILILTVTNNHHPDSTNRIGMRLKIKNIKDDNKNRDLSRIHGSNGKNPNTTTTDNRGTHSLQIQCILCLWCKRS